NKADLFIKELAEMPEVSAISKSLMVTSVGRYYSANMKYIDQKDSVDIWYNAMDEHYLSLHGHKLLVGRNFSVKPVTAEAESEVIVNEQVVKRFNIGKGNPEKALGETISVEGKKLTIIGVLKDFHY